MDISKYLSDNGRVLKFPDNFNQPLVIDGIRCIPDSVQQLSFGHYFNQPLAIDGIHCIPDSVQQLEFGYYFNQPINEYDLPPSITKIIFRNKPNENTVLPYSIKEVIINNIPYYPNTPEFDKLFTIYHPPIKSAIQ